MLRVRTHPGEVLAMHPLGLSSAELGRAFGVAGTRISNIVRQRRDMSADTAIRLGRFLRVDPRFWPNCLRPVRR
jgi:antitoxin HigA-1